MDDHHSTGATAYAAPSAAAGTGPDWQPRADSLFLGRARLIQTIAERLEPDSPATGCLLIGEEGSGKSALMRHVLQLHGQDAYTIHVRGSAFAGRTPFGALTFLLSDLDPEASSHPVLILRGLTALVRERAAGRTIILAVDNAEELDEFSAMVLSQMVVNRSARMIAAFRDFSAAPSEFMGLWREGLLTRLDLEPMLPSDCAHLLEAELRGPVSRAAAEDLARISGGNPSRLLAAAADYRDSGRLVLAGRVWVLAPGRQPAFPRLYAAMGIKLSALEPGQRELLEFLALAGALPLTQILEHVDSLDVDALQEAGLLLLTHAGVPALSLVDPTLGTVLRAQLDAGRRQELLDRILPDPIVSPPLRSAEWLLSAGAKLTPELALSAGRAANDEGDSAAAERFITADPNYLSSPAAVLELACAHLHRRDHQAAAGIVDRHRQAGGAPSASVENLRLLMAESRAGCLAVTEQIRDNLPPLPEGGTNTGKHTSLLDEGERMLAALRDRGMGRAEAAQLTGELTLARARCLSQHGKYTESAAFLSGVYARGDEIGRGFRVLVGSWLCEAWGMTDRQSDALELAATLWNLLADGLPSDLEEGPAAEARARLVHVLLVTGAVAAADACLAPETDAVEHGAFGGTVREICEGMLRAFEGRGPAATAHLLPALRQLEAADPFGMLRTVQCAAAYAAALQGQDDRAWEHLRSAGAVSGSPSWAMQRTGAHFAVLAQGVLKSPETGPTLEELAAADEERGAGSYALLATLGAVRLGRTDAAQQLLDIASGLQGNFARFCEIYAKGAGEFDAQLLLLAADAAHADGHDLLAREIREQALEVASGAGDRATVRFIHRSRRLLSAEADHDGEVEDCLRGLTARERVIARSAANGTSNKIIAQELSISVRTVEGHLYQIYSKLHVGSRRELARLVAAGKPAAVAGAQ
ncbi:LuxR family transcriptional regulator [Arthrobacter sp. Helios]|uniref:LuxR family transcriptional regulator n=1 Tax=Arthrobacter sp. Helios TaxID=2828862 RepID=UPI00205D66EA|nr:LuxR family transcriptional regulator [Arthrobacter sp. Helios]UPO77631.1 LuxR family transcriptional regulator [Arthrobacter sp. Helios]